MAGVSYIAKVGLDFDGLKGKPRVEAGEPIPAKVPESEIVQLLSDGHIEEVKDGTEHADQ